MEEERRPDVSLVVRDNERAAAEALSRGDFVHAYLLLHVLIEALLRHFLRVQKEYVTFSELIRRYDLYLDEQGYPFPTFKDELTKLNGRRNRIVHELWRRGYTATNAQADQAARAAMLTYGLLIEWLETFDEEITETGFRYDVGA